MDYYQRVKYGQNNIPAIIVNCFTTYNITLGALDIYGLTTRLKSHSSSQSQLQTKL